MSLPLTGSAQCTERSACENSNHRGLCDSANIHYIDMHLRRQAEMWSHRKPMEYTYLYEGVEPSSLTINSSGCLQLLGDFATYSCSY